MRKITFVKFFYINTCNLEEFDLDCFKEFVLNNYMDGITHILCSILRYNNGRTEVFVYKLDFEYSKCEDKYIEEVYL